MTRTLVAIAFTAATIISTPTLASQAVVSSDCHLQRFIEAYAWQALDDAERADVSPSLQNGLKVYVRTMRDATQRVCGGQS